MRIPRHLPGAGATARQAGSILLITVVLSGILGLSIGYYLWWVRSENLMVAESQAWNSALALAEAGVEEGLAQVNVSFGTNYTGSALLNWGSSSPGVYGPRTGTLGNGSFSVVLVAGNPGPSIISTGYAAVAVTGRLVTRVVQVTTSPNPAFAYALGASQSIQGNGRGLTVDSYDSSDPSHNSGGMYSAPARLTNGDVASMSGLTNAGTVQINGKLYVGAGASANLGRMGSATATINDFNQEFRPVPTAPPSGWVTFGTNSTNQNLAVLGSGNYMTTGDLNIGAGQALSVSGDVVLYVGGNVNMADGAGPNADAQLHIQSGASLQLFVGGPTATLAQVVIDNPDCVTNFQYFGLPSNTNLSWDGNTYYVGNIYAPQASISLGSSAGGFGPRSPSHTADFQGSCIGQTIQFNQKFQFHYDQALKQRGMMAGFVVTSWQEL